MRILVICGAGASSTFVAQRLRRAAEMQGLDWDAVAGMEHSVASGTHDLVLVGPHLADRLESVAAIAHVPVALLPEDIFGDRDGSRALAIVRSLLADPGTPSEGRS